MVARPERSVIQQGAPVNPGLYDNMSFEDYLAIPAISSSSIKAGCRTMAHMAHQWTNKIEPTPVMQFGTLTDTLLFEPATFAARFFVTPDKIDRRKKTQIAEWEALAGGRDLIDPETLARSRATIAGIYKHKTAAKLLTTPGLAQLVAVWHDPATGLLCKARADRAVVGVIGLDVKCSHSAAPADFARTATNLRYAIQAAHYEDGFEVVTGIKTPWVFVVIEDDEPHKCATYTLPPDVMACARQSIRRITHAFAEAQQTGDWSGYPDEVVELPMPPWAARVEGPDMPVLVPDDIESPF